MAKYVEKTLSWNPAPDSDIVGYNVYVAAGVDPPDYGFLSTFVSEGSSLILPFPGMILQDGPYTFGIASVDDFGNESDMAFITEDLDFLAPSPPTGLSIS